MNSEEANWIAEHEEEVPSMRGAIVCLRDLLRRLMEGGPCGFCISRPSARGSTVHEGSCEYIGAMDVTERFDRPQSATDVLIGEVAHGGVEVHGVKKYGWGGIETWRPVMYGCMHHHNTAPEARRCPEWMANKARWEVMNGEEAQWIDEHAADGETRCRKCKDRQDVIEGMQEAIGLLRRVAHRSWIRSSEFVPTASCEPANEHRCWECKQLGTHDPACEYGQAMEESAMFVPGVKPKPKRAVVIYGGRDDPGASIAIDGDGMSVDTRWGAERLAVIINEQDDALRTKDI